MFAILIPVSLSPLIITLLWAERKAKHLGIVKPSGGSAAHRSGNHGIIKKVISISNELDLVGLVLLGAAVALLLLPLTLSTTVKDGWKNGMHRS
jgi:hypothetical protein